MTGFVDLHTHVIPGVDDGPATLEETIEVLRAAYDAGTRALVATPHMFMPMFDNRSASAIRQAFAELIAALGFMSRRDPDAAFLTELELFLGAENFCSAEFVTALDKGEILTLNDGRHLLLEFGPHLPLDSIESALLRVLDSGLVPLLAHVERYPFFSGNGMRRLGSLVEKGCVAQVNAESVVAPRLSRSRRAAMRFLKSGLVTIVASDTHDTHMRRPRLDEAWTVLAARFGDTRATAWMVTNPRAVIGS